MSFDMKTVSVMKMQGCCDRVPAIIYLEARVFIYSSKDIYYLSTIKRGHIIFFPQEY
jgi:hypothetical protein